VEKAFSSSALESPHFAAIDAWSLSNRLWRNFLIETQRRISWFGVCRGTSVWRSLSYRWPVAGITVILVHCEFYVVLTVFKPVYLGLDDWLTVHHSITSVNFQLDAQNSLFIYLFIYNTFIKILYMFRAVHCSSLGGLIISMHHLVSSLPVGDCPVHRLRKNPFSTGAQDSHLQRVMISDAA